MNDSDFELLEQRLRTAGHALTYPLTPRIADKVTARLHRSARPRLIRGRLAGALIAILILALTLILVPPARAALLDFIQIGVVRIFRVQPAPTSTPQFQFPVTATPKATFIPSVLQLAGETTLSDAQSNMDFPILLPTYPSDLGQPDRVYLQDAGGAMLVLVWMDRDRPDKVRLSLDEIAPGSWAIGKSQPHLIEETTVNGQRGVWVEGPYMLQVSNGNYEATRLIGGRTLIWTQGDITYRLETDLSLDEAIKIAESLRPLESLEILVPADLDHARPFVQWLNNAGVTVLSVQYSMAGSLFESANQAAWIKTDLGIAEAVFFLDPVRTEYIQVTPVQSQEAWRYLYKIQAPPPIMQKSVTIDAAFPLYFTVRRGIFIQTSNAELNKVLQAYP